MGQIAQVSEAEDGRAGRFECVENCSDCCVEREYYPSVKFGKIGVLLLPDEAARIGRLADARGLDVRIVPRIGVSRRARGAGARAPDEVIAYQMMGADEDGNTCPFLDPSARSPHGGLACSIYGDRPLACRAYPVESIAPVRLDGRCRFCEACPSAASDGGAIGGLDGELEALALIRAGMEGGGGPGGGAPTAAAGSGGRVVWRYATGVGRTEDAGRIRRGWFRERGTGGGGSRTRARVGGGGGGGKSTAAHAQPRKQQSGE